MSFTILKHTVPVISYNISLLKFSEKIQAFLTNCNAISQSGEMLHLIDKNG